MVNNTENIANTNNVGNLNSGLGQRDNQNPYIEEQTTQWPKGKVQNHKQRSTKHTHKTKDRVTQTQLKTAILSL